MHVVVIGTGYVGTVTGACLAYLGHSVTCVDTDAAKIASLQRGQSPIYEPGLDDLLALASQRGGISFTTDLAPAVAASDFVFIAVGTPPLPDGQANLAYLEAAAHGIGRAMDPSKFRVVINKSTVPVGCGNLVETLVREGISETRPESLGTIKFGVASNPEFLREGSAIADSLYPDRIVVGTSDPATLAAMCALYEPLVDQQFDPPPGIPRRSGFSHVPLVATSLTSAEMIKYAANAFLAMKIGFANEIANICERVGAEAPEVMQGIGLDSRIGPRFLNPGLGWGGSCFRKDVQALIATAREYGYDTRLLPASIEINSAQRQLAIQKLQEKIYILKGRTVGLLGLAFKPDTDDLRDAPSITIAERLLQLGARVKAYDPVAVPACRAQHPDLKIRYCESITELANGSDALILVTEWDEFRRIDLAALRPLMTTPILIDGRNVFTADRAAAAGFDYSAIGSPRTARKAISS